MKHCLVMTAIGFISGAVMYSWLIPMAFFGMDIRRASTDGNPGCSNVIRQLGVPVGLLCMALDLLKAFLPVFISVSFIGIRGIFLVPVAAAPVAGHAFSPMMKFNGGKAVSTTYGSLLGLILISRFVILVALVMAFFRFIVVIRPDSAAGIINMAVISALAVIFAPELWLKMLVVIISVIVTIKQLQHPDGGEYRVSIGHYSLAYKDNRLRFSKI